MNIYMICTLWTPFQAERDWKNSYREILLIPLYIFYSLWIYHISSRRNAGKNARECPAILRILVYALKTPFILQTSWRARRCPWKKMKKKIQLFLAYYTPRPPMSVHKKISAHSVQPFGRLYATYLRMSCFIYVDINIKKMNNLKEKQ